MTEESPHVSDNQNARPELSKEDPLSLLGPESYTAYRLKHATPEHLYLTTRRCFIGPIPEGWLKSHRRDWYKHHLHIHYSAHSASFSAAADTGNHRRVTDIDGPDLGSLKPHSFPQPKFLVEEHFESEQAEASRSERDVVAVDTPAVTVPRASPKAGNVTDDGLGRRADKSSEPSRAPQTSKPTGGEYRDTAGEFPQSESDLKSLVSDGFPQSPSVLPKKQLTDVPKSSLKPPPRPKASRKPSGTSSFVTARESPEPSSPKLAPLDDGEHGRQSLDSHARKEGSGSVGGGSFLRVESVSASSTAPLLGQEHKADEQQPVSTSDQRKSILNKKGNRQSANFSEIRDRSGIHETNERQQQHDPRTTSGLVRFNLPETEDDSQKDQMLKVRLAQFGRREALKRLRKGKVQDGEILKMEKMLVRVDFTSHDIQEEFDENDSQMIESRTLDKWREFMVVCRESSNEEEEFVLQMYKSRVIHAIEKKSSKQRSTHQLILNRKTRINIFSSLDKTIVLWEPYKQGHRILIMRPRSGAKSMEWYTFLRNLLGWKRPSMLQVNVPDLEVSLRIDQPFENLESSEVLAQAIKGDTEALAKTVEEEKAVAARIVLRCMKMLEDSPEWGSIIDAWAAPAPTVEGDGLSRILTSHGGKLNATKDVAATFLEDNAYTPTAHSLVGLAWKRYDRLEWVHGPNEQNMYGTIGMEKSHELELRPKQHYPTTVVNKEGQIVLEPAPVEGFLVRLTSQKGATQRMGKLFYKRLYFSTHNQYLVFNRPAQAEPPPPPVLPMRTDSKVPSASQIAHKIPLIYAINPYPLRGQHVQWLCSDNSATTEEIINHDRDAYDENERKLNLLLKCDGIIDLCNVKKVRRMRKGATPADQLVDEGSEVDFDEDVPDSVDNDGQTSALDDERTFELVLKNGLVVRLQTFDKATKREWIHRLRALVSYWRLRSAADIALYKSVRRRNLENLNIDEDMEAVLGQFARKWEVRQSYASPQLYHMCGISCCRSIQMAGVLYRKPRLHTSFQRCQVILCHGHLLVFEDVMRTSSGKMVPHIQHQRVTSLDLNDCYIYSGLITSDDLLYASSGSAALDRTHPGSHHGLPRMYLGDGWSSTDEDTMTCFVVWHGKRRSWFRTEKAQGRGHGTSAKLKMVRSLGKEGRAVVFKTRSRAERDHWVMSIGMEIERITKNEDVRIVK